MAERELNYCSVCNKRINSTSLPCLGCGLMFCSTHKTATKVWREEDSRNAYIGTATVCLECRAHLPRVGGALSFEGENKQ